MTKTMFERHEKAAACILYYDDGSFTLKSYNTIVITVNAEGWLHINGLYSRTTIKHIGWFAKLVNLNYSTLKQLLLDNVDININTHEIKVWA